ncbi:MAG: hypothetical protein LIO79_06065 [Rikenellaceae bacterium]|nr:hypothetical protein [Rikenellaceae bacterium]
MITVKNSRQLGQAIKGDNDTIKIEGSLKNRVLKIRSIKTAAWISAGALLGTAIALALMRIGMEPTIRSTAPSRIAHAA